MAGSFGFEAAHVEVSKKVGELVLLPAVRQAPADTLIVADGFSCREQIEQETGRRAVHIAQALHAAIAGRRLDRTPIEDDILPPRRVRAFPTERAAAALIVVGVTAAFALSRRWWNR